MLAIGNDETALDVEYATRLSAGGVADERVTQMLRQGDSQVFKNDSQMKLQMKREALEKLNREANEMTGTLCQNVPVNRAGRGGFYFWNCGECFRIRMTSTTRP